MKIPFVSLLLLSVLSLKAQDSIQMKKEKGRYTFDVIGKDASRLDDKRPIRTIVDILDDVPEAAVYAKKAKGNYDAAVTVSVVGGFLIGWELGQLIGGEELNPIVLGSGVGVALIAIPFMNGFKKNMNTSIDIYSIDIYNNSNRVGHSFQIKGGILNNGVGVALTFL